MVSKLTKYYKIVQLPLCFIDALNLKILTIPCLHLLLLLLQNHFIIVLQLQYTKISNITVNQILSKPLFLKNA